MTPFSSVQPDRRSFLVMSRYYMTAFNNIQGWTQPIQGSAFDSGRFKEEAVIIDADCRKFPVTGATKRGWSRAWSGADLFFNLFYSPAKRSYRFEFLVGEPQQLTFEQARDENVEHVCKHRWASKAGGSPENFRKHHAAQINIVGVINSIGLLGKYPF